MRRNLRLSGGRCRGQSPRHAGEARVWRASAASPGLCPRLAGSSCPRPAGPSSGLQRPSSASNARNRRLSQSRPDCHSFALAVTAPRRTSQIRGQCTPSRAGVLPPLRGVGRFPGCSRRFGRLHASCLASCPPGGRDARQPPARRPGRASSAALPSGPVGAAMQAGATGSARTGAAGSPPVRGGWGGIALGGRPAVPGPLLQAARPAFPTLRRSGAAALGRHAAAQQLPCTGCIAAPTGPDGSPRVGGVSLATTVRGQQRARPGQDAQRRGGTRRSRSEGTTRHAAKTNAPTLPTAQTEPATWNAARPATKTRGGSAHEKRGAVGRAGEAVPERSGGWEN